MRALRIDPNMSVTDIDLPAGVAQHARIRDLVGGPGSVDIGRYHPRALLHLHGEGRAIGLKDNLVAWALASAWRGMPLYPLHGPAVITGRSQDGGVAPLDDDLVQHAQTIARTVRETLREWQTRRPASNQAAIGELLAYVTRDVHPIS
ncbi:hypothetical protein GCM10011579_095870 [Streptomyces albiflavescens]|uniref:Uncharacterized protein n=1 Tax=Streptomyces albiflavescens TaxID=1623582 RepID=A0A917YH11_9ACTN|nr:hypothetical protein [Streptomyces albiflavescens]GGN95373.1 hypothetical protein GCM10011579_095870 [Streptomyces albiflavescens]